MTPSEQFRENEESGHAMSERIEREHRFGHPITGPQWYRFEDMPQLPGLWLTEYDGISRGRCGFVTDRYTAEDLARGAPFHCTWVYGPIPEHD